MQKRNRLLTPKENLFLSILCCTDNIEDKNKIVSLLKSTKSKKIAHCILQEKYKNSKSKAALEARKIVKSSKFLKRNPVPVQLQIRT